MIAYLVLLASTAVPSHAATLTAASCSATHVQATINIAVTGDLVLVPPGVCNWGTTMVSIVKKNITVQGAGIDVTNITGATYAWRIGSVGTGNSSRLTGFTVTVNAGGTAVLVDGDGWRVDHMKFVSATTALCTGVSALGLRPGVPYGPTGLVDHSEFINCRTLVVGFPDLASKAGAMWVSPLGLGDVNAVYVEDNTYTFTGSFPNMHDANYGGRYVFRFNTTIGGSSIDNHSHQSFRGTRRFEIYNNTINFNNPFFTPLFIRGGTGTIFQNAIASGFSEPYLSLDNVRSFTSNFEPMCDGTQAQDGNQHVAPAPDAGWPCRDQIGWNTDTFQWTTSTPHPSQRHEPAYFWSNTIGGTPAVVNIRNGTEPWIQPDRDYYTQGTMTVQTSSSSPFNGTTGVGVGTLANRPTTCTAYGDSSGAGVGYWATDEGEWNSTNGVTPDGRLYRCTATNTWKLYYMPFPYPHPLQARGGGGRADIVPPLVPTNLTVQ